MNVLKSRWFGIEERTDGDDVIQAPDDVRIVAMREDGNVLLISEPSPALDGKRVWLFPGGTIESGEPIQGAGSRELQEEAGLDANEWTLLATQICPWAKYLQVKTTVLLARDLYSSTLPGDEAHSIGQRWVNPDNYEHLIFSGEIQDATTIALLALAKVGQQRWLINTWAETIP